jgi:hypothetical protein
VVGLCQHVNQTTSSIKSRGDFDHLTYQWLLITNFIPRSYCYSPEHMFILLGNNHIQTHRLKGSNGKHRQCTYNVILRRVRLTICAVEEQKVLNILSVCVCSLSYPACKAHASYYIVICGLSGSIHIFPHYLINGTIFGKKLLNIKCVF